MERVLQGSPIGVPPCTSQEVRTETDFRDKVISKIEVRKTICKLKEGKAACILAQ